MEMRIEAKELFQFLNNQINATEIQTIGFAETIKRFNRVFKHYDKSSEILNKN